MEKNKSSEFDHILGVLTDDSYLTKINCKEGKANFSSENMQYDIELPTKIQGI